MGSQATGQNLVGSILIKLPIVVLADDGPLVFRSIEDAERYLEPIDVRNGEYRAFDARGCELRLSVEAEVRGWLWKSKVEVTRISQSDRTSESGELRERVLAWVGQHYPDRLEEATGNLQQIIEKLVAWFGYQE